MTVTDALLEIAERFGGTIRHRSGNSSTQTITVQFPGTAAADRCKAVIDALAPCTGAVFGPGRLVLSPPTTLIADWRTAA